MPGQQTDASPSHRYSPEVIPIYIITGLAAGGATWLVMDGQILAMIVVPR